MSDDWHTLANPDEIPSPALLIYPDRIEENIRRMISMAGSADRLRPHVKTHKLGEIVQLQIKAGITRFKCATIAEAEMLAQAGARDVLLANQLVGPNARRLAKLAGWFREVRFSTIADDAEAVGNLASAGQEAGITLPVLLDLDGGMGRTGIPLGQAAVTLYKLIDQLPGVEPAGLHLYDGHLHDSDPAERLAKWETMMEQLKSFRTDVEAAGLPVPAVLALRVVSRSRVLGRRHGAAAYHVDPRRRLAESVGGVRLVIVRLLAPRYGGVGAHLTRACALHCCGRCNLVELCKAACSPRALSVQRSNKGVEH